MLQIEVEQHGDTVKVYVVATDPHHVSTCIQIGEASNPLEALIASAVALTDLHQQVLKRGLAEAGVESDEANG